MRSKPQPLRLSNTFHRENRSSVLPARSLPKYNLKPVPVHCVMQTTLPLDYCSQTTPPTVAMKVLLRAESLGMRLVSLQWHRLCSLVVLL